MVRMGFHLSDIKNKSCLKNVFKDKEKLRKVGFDKGVNGFLSYIKDTNCLKNVFQDKGMLRKVGSGNGVNGFPSE